METRKDNFENVIQWWEVGKVQIKIFCQQFSYNNNNNNVIVKRNIERLEKGINDLEKLLDLNALGETIDLKKKRLVLKTLLEERAKGALVRARISSIKEMDAPTKLFFNLERKVVKQKKNALPLEGQWHINFGSHWN